MTTSLMLSVKPKDTDEKNVKIVNLVHSTEEDKRQKEEHWYKLWCEEFDPAED